MNDKAKATLDGLVASLSDPSFIADTVSFRVFGARPDAPIANWSALNQLLVRKAGAGDARGFRQWQAVGRRVKKGAKATYILAPLTKRISDEDAPDGEKVIIYGFKTIPVFPYEMTEGEPLPEYTPTTPDSLPLIAVAQSLNVDVSFAPSSGLYAGYYSPGRSEIVLCSDSEHVFFHELSHAIDDALGGMNLDYALGEVVAEISASFLASMYGRLPSELGHTYKYIREYSGKKHVSQMIASALDRVVAIYQFVAEHVEVQAA